MPEHTVQTKFFTENQNNSGGDFDHNPEAGIGYRLCVEARDAAEATSRMKQITDYYLGKGYDCSCCGERWHFYLSDDDGSDEPTMYGPGSDPLTGGWGIPSYIHYYDGRIERRD